MANSREQKSFVASKIVHWSDSRARRPDGTDENVVLEPFSCSFDKMADFQFMFQLELSKTDEVINFVADLYVSGDRNVYVRNANLAVRGSAPGHGPYLYNFKDKFVGDEKGLRRWDTKPYELHETYHNYGYGYHYDEDGEKRPHYLTFECEITYEGVMSMGDVPRSTFSKDMLSLLRSGEGSDFTLILISGEEKTEVKAHKVILKTRSRFFQSMLRSGLKEATTNEAPIKVDPKLFKVILKFIYCGSLPANIGDVALDLHPLADFFQENELKEICFSIIASRLNQGNISQHLKVAEELEWNGLKDICLKTAEDRAMIERKSKELGDLHMIKMLFPLDRIDPIHS